MYIIYIILYALRYTYIIILKYICSIYPICIESIFSLCIDGDHLKKKFMIINERKQWVEDEAHY